MDCDGTLTDVIANRVCTISLETLKASPFDLVKDESVWIRIVSQNFYGDSIYSDAGNGAVIQLVPDAPINLANDPLTTDDTIIRFTWDEGLSNGGTPVIDFDIYYNQGSSVSQWTILAEDVVDTFYQTTIPLTAGEIYSFKLTARNAVGVGLESDSVSILAAKIPDSPIPLVHIPEQTGDTFVGLTWTEGIYDGASPVIDYTVSYAEESSDTWTFFAQGIIL